MLFLFHLCVRFLEWLAKKCHTTYEAINVWIFCILWPLITLVPIGIVIWQRYLLAHSK